MKKKQSIITGNLLRINYNLSDIIMEFRGSISIEPHDFILFTGDSGCGKSTYFKFLTRLIPWEIPGKIKTDYKVYGRHFQEKCEYDSGHNHYFPLMLFQNPYTQIVTPFVKDELVFPMENHNFLHKDISKKFHEICEEFKIHNLLEKKTSDLSGGEIQKVQLASLVSLNPDILFLDEPTAFLDPEAKSDFYSIVRKIKSRYTICLIEHDLQYIHDFPDKIYSFEFSEPPQGEERMNGNQGIKFSVYSLKEYFNIPLFFKDKEQLKRNLSFSEHSIRKSILEKINFHLFLDNGNKNGKQEKTNIKKNKNLKSKNSMSDFSLYLENISFSYTREKTDFPLLKNINLTVKDEAIAIVGKNGTGKTTFLKLIAGQLKPYTGKLFVDKKNLSFIFQNPETHFLFDTIEKEIMWNIKKSFSAKTDQELIFHSFVDVLDFGKYMKTSPFALSEGEKRRLTFILGLLMNKKIILMDEPSFGQDPANRQMIIDFIFLLKQIGKTMIIVTHDIGLADVVADRIFELKNHTLLEKGMSMKKSETVEIYG